MGHRMSGIVSGENIIGRILEIRQGLDPVLVSSDALSYPGVGSSGAFAALAPDLKAGVVTFNTSTSGSNFRYYPDMNTLANPVVPAAGFASTANVCAISNDHYAIGGTGSPFLYVFKRSDHSLVTVATSGLGSIYGVDFSPDGTKMVVTHSTTPYLRVYNTATWAYTDAVTVPGGAGNYGVAFTSDSARFVVMSASSPYLAIYNASTMVRSFGYTASTKYNPATSYIKPIVRHPTTANSFLLAFSSSPYIAEFNADTQTFTDFTALTAGGVIGAGYSLIVDPDPTEDAVYLRHSNGSTSPSRTMSKFKISTRAPYPAQSPVYRNTVWGSTSALTPFVITYDTPYKITGTVRDINNNPVARVVRAHWRDTGELAAQTTSNAATGNYELRVPGIGPFDVQFMTAAGELLNDLFFAQTEPQPV
ncbi:YncE family protein [Variovorax paradoxus]|uniref:YncE family protein n=1 Tax=Variovorax paradoxus TaxID=34073 RepID=UPI003D6574BB